jgi:hypothetical protein
MMHLPMNLKELESIRAFHIKACRPSVAGAQRVSTGGWRYLHLGQGRMLGCRHNEPVDRDGVQLASYKKNPLSR